MLKKLGLAIDIRYNASWPAFALSNAVSTPFEVDGVRCESMEGFLQSLRCEDEEEQRRVCRMSGLRAKAFGKQSDKQEGYSVRHHGVYWKGVRLERNGGEYSELLRGAYRALYRSSPEFREALEETGNRRLFYTNGSGSARNSVISEKEFTTILTTLRREIFSKC